jgi:histidinol-phosphatase
MADDVLTAALEIARAAGGLAAERFRAALPISRKADGSEVTAADVEVERLIRRLIDERFPGDRVYGEEEGGCGPGADGRRWIVDPINGTTLFARQLPGFDLLLAVEQDGEPAVGVIHYPVTGITLYARRGGGAWRQRGDERPERLAVSSRTQLRGAAVGMHNPSTWSEQLLMTLHREVALMSWAGAGQGVAAGWLDAAVIAGHPMGYEDVATLPVLITEAGGRVTDLAGGDVLAGAGDVLTSNGHVHDQLLELVAGLPTGPRPPPAAIRGIGAARGRTTVVRDTVATS